MDDDTDVVEIAGWYRLAAAVVRGLAQDDPELAHWRAAGHRIRERMGETPATVTAARRPGHMIADFDARTRSTHAPGRRRARTQG